MVLFYVAFGADDMLSTLFFLKKIKQHIARFFQKIKSDASSTQKLIFNLFFNPKHAKNTLEAVINIFETSKNPKKPS
jgi:hypothetical protein